MIIVNLKGDLKTALENLFKGLKEELDDFVDGKIEFKAVDKHGNFLYEI